MGWRVCVPVVQLTLLLLSLAAPMGQACPRSCNCYQANEVHCTFRSLLHIPPGLPAHTRRMNLGFNSISRIHNSSLAGLKKVELLMLHSNDLQYLPDGVFRDLKSLQILKLSYNKLREISSSLTFSGLTSLLRLYLDHNLLQHIHPRALLQLPSLRLLRLQGNKLHQLHPHAMCTLSLLNTYYFSTLRHLDLSNNSLTTLPSVTLATAPLLETLVLQANPWSCDCRMNWLLTWSLAHPGLMKCPGGPQCPICASPSSLQGQGLLEQTDLSCTSPVIPSPGRDTPLETEPGEIQSSESFREPLGAVSLALSDHQGNSVDLGCNITHSSDSQDIAPPPDLSLSSSSPLPLALSLSLDCPVERQSYETLWRILAYYSETAVRLEREIMLSKAPALAYRYRQVAEADGYYHTGVKASVKARPQWLLQPAVSIQLNRAQSNGGKVQLIYSTRVSAHPDPHPSAGSAASQPWVLISTNQTPTALAAVAGTKVELSCPLLSSGNPKVQWILPDGSKLIVPSRSLDERIVTSNSGLLIQKVKLSDAGVYYCVAWTGGDVDGLPLRLAVEESSVPPSGEQVGPPVSGKVGEPVSLSCKASGSPSPHLSWVLPDGNIVRRGVAVSGGVTIQSNGSLSLPKPSQRDAGHYRCVVVNQYGSDSLSMQLELNSRQPPPLRTSFPRGPQSAAGRSTKIRAPLLHEVEEGSGTEEEEERTPTGSRRRLRPLQPSPNRRYPIRGRGPIREGAIRKGGRPVSSADHRRNRFENRHRVSTNKQRIDPQKWADLLAKIRQKTTQTNNSESVTTEIPTTVGKKKDVDTGRHGDNQDSERDTAERAGGKETEGSTVDDADLQEEGLEPIPSVLTETQTHSETKTDTESDTDIKEGIESVTETQTDTEIETETRTQTEEASQQAETITNPETQRESVTSKPTTATNDIIPDSSEGLGRDTNPNPTRTRTRPQKRPFPNLGPNSRPQSPWNSRRRIGQRRRIMNRPRERPLTPPTTLPDSLNARSKTRTPDTATDRVNLLLLASTTTSPAILRTEGDHVRTASNGVVINPLSPPVSDTRGVSTPESASPSLTPSPSWFTSLPPSPKETHADMMTHSAGVPDNAESTLFSTQTPAPATVAQTHVPGTQSGAHTHGTQTNTKTHTASGEDADSPVSTHSEELERNFLDVAHVSHFSTSPSPTSSSVASSAVASAAATATTAKMTTTPSTALINTLATSFAAGTTSTYTTTASEETIPTTTIASTTARPIKTTTTTSTTTRIHTTTTPTTTTSTTSSSSSTTTTTTTSTKTHTVLSPTTTSATSSSTSPSTTTTSTTSLKAVPTTPITTTTTATTTTPTTVTSSTSTTTTSKATPSTPPTTTITTSTSTTTSSRERQSVDLADPRGRAVPGVPSQSRPPPDWRNPGANSIPDSHGSRPQRPPSPSHPAIPGAPVVRIKPRIADPHIRTVSFPAESTARLACEAHGEPKPSITWTKVATGVVMSIHSRAQRFEVLPNGTLVIQNVQLQDRGTYICSAHSFLGRDRLLTTLDVWTRPPRMQLASYRESTIHQGGEVHLECRADGIPTPLLSWVLPDRSVLTSDVASTSRITMDSNGTLHILVTLPSDRGVYRCVASNSAGAASSSVRVHVSSLPPVIQQPREEHLLLSPGRPVYAHCSARGAPPPTLRWRIPDGTLVRPSQFLHGNLFVLPNGTLHIRKVGSKESGNYECTASNAVGADKRTVRVEIEVEGRQPGSGNGRGQVLLPEKPSPSSSFNKDRTWSVSQPSNPATSHQFSPPTVISSPTQLTNTNKTNPPSVSQPSTLSYNTKDLSSSASNTKVSSSNPSDKSSAVLHPSPVSPFSKARIVSTSHPITTVHYGDTLQLHCSVTGSPTPIIIWRTANRKLVDMHYSFDRRLKVHPNGTLSVHAVTEKDAGDYLCIARNKVADDYRLLRVSVATKPAKIEPKQPLNQMVVFGKPLKVDCQASGLPDPAVRWSLPDGTMVNSVLQGEDRGRRARGLTVFDNGTLLVPAVGVGEEGEYTCYAENQGGQDTMKVKVKVMMTSPPSFTDDRSYHLVKVHQGTTARIRCQATGDPAPTVTWYSPTRHVIPRTWGSGFYPGRVLVSSDGTLEVRLAQRVDSGNYTCRASNSVGERNMVVGIEVEAPNYGQSSHVGGQGWSPSNGPGNSHRTSNNNNAGVNQYGSTDGVRSKLDNGKNGDNNGRIRNTVSNNGANIGTSGFNPALRGDSRNGFNGPVSGITTQLGSSVISVGVSGARNVGIKADSIGINRNGPGIVSSSNNVGNSHSTFRGDAEKNPATNNNEVVAGKDFNANSNGNSGIGGFSRNVGAFSREAGTGTLPGTGFGNVGVADDKNRISGGLSHTGVIASNLGTKNSTIPAVGVMTTIKLRAEKGQTVVLPCPSQGSPPPRVSWLLHGNGVLPAPYYGSRLTVYRNGSLELRGLRGSDSGTFVCVVRGERGQTRIQVELEISEPQEEPRSPHRAPIVEKATQERVGLIEAPGSAVSPAQSSLSKQVLPATLRPSIPVTPKLLHRGLPLVSAPHPVGPPPRSTSPVSEAVVSTRTAPLVSIINGETLRLPCSSVSENHGQAHDSLSWTTPSGQVLSRGESSDSGRKQVQGDGTLVVQQASVFDRGSYTCRSTSYDSSSVSVVTVPVIVIAYPPRITKGPSPVTYTRPGVAVELPCLTIATPRATVTWETPDLTQLRVTGQARIYGNRYLSPQGSLVIQNPTSRDTGFYRCTAKNVIGVDTKATYLHVI